MLEKLLPLNTLGPMAVTVTELTVCGICSDVPALGPVYPTIVEPLIVKQLSDVAASTPCSFGAKNKPTAIARQRMQHKKITLKIFLLSSFIYQIIITSI